MYRSSTEKLGMSGEIYKGVELAFHHGNRKAKTMEHAGCKLLSQQQVEDKRCSPFVSVRLLLINRAPKDLVATWGGTFCIGDCLSRT
jgi:hypothetical protein